MRIFGFGDHSNFRLLVFESDHKPGLFHWLIEDHEGKPRAMPTVIGPAHGFDSHEAAYNDAKEVVDGLGADIRDLDLIPRIK